MNRVRLLTVLLLIFSSTVFAERLPGRYIVELTESPAAAQMSRQPGRAGLRGAEAAALRTRVRAGQQDVRERLAQRQARILDSVETVANALFVEIPDSQASSLAAVPGVRRVYPVRLFRRVLDRAVVLHTVTDAWNRIGMEHAGEGVKIAIIDSGIDISHPSFQESTMSPPGGFPRANYVSDLELTNGKVIVARSYVPLLQYRDPDWSARDHVGHGTALASAAAGVPAAGPLATIAGVAPRAWLGNYKIFGTPGFNDYATDDAILKAIDDAVADGMDIINLSLGDDFAPRYEDDIDAQAVERAVQAGVIVVVSAGNNGPALNTIASPATAPSAIAVGATTNDRTFAARVDIEGLASYVAVPGSGPVPSGSISAPLMDVTSLDQNGMACSILPDGGLKGAIALILRGNCTFETKLNNAQRAGAVAAVVYTADSSTAPFIMGAGAATLPAEMIAWQDGIEIRQRLSEGQSVTVTLHFDIGAVAVPANRLTDFSAAGPSVDLAIKPDLMAAGKDIYVATQNLDFRGDMYDASGFIAVNGTSFSAPIVAGAAALVKSARPGLTVEAYRSLLINSAAQSVAASGGGQPALQHTGAGLLDVDAALRSTIAVSPVSLSFGAGGSDVSASRTLSITNVGTETETFTLTVNSQTGGTGPVIESPTFEIAPGASVEAPVLWTGAGLAPGAYEGFIAIEGSTSGTRVRVPYWYAVRSDEPAHINVLSTISSGRRGSWQQDAVYIRVTDLSGVILPGVEPVVTAVSGGGAFGGFTNYDSEVPGVIGLNLRLGNSPGTNVFRIQAGTATVDLTITGQ